VHNFKFIADTVTALYDNADHTFELHYCLLWDWALDLLNNEQLMPHFKWDVWKLFKFNGTNWVHFFNEPWTGHRWWEVQVCVNEALQIHFLLVTYKFTL
jgi:hypothetical protein